MDVLASPSPRRPLSAWPPWRARRPGCRCCTPPARRSRTAPASAAAARRVVGGAGDSRALAEPARVARPVPGTAHRARSGHHCCASPRSAATADGRPRLTTLRSRCLAPRQHPGSQFRVTEPLPPSPRPRPRRTTSPHRARTAAPCPGRPAPLPRRLRSLPPWSPLARRPRAAGCSAPGTAWSPPRSTRRPATSSPSPADASDPASALQASRRPTAEAVATQLAVLGDAQMWARRAGGDPGAERAHRDLAGRRRWSR